MNIKGVIFDMDGLILDTEKLYQRFWREASEKYGFKMSREQALMLRSLDKNRTKELLNKFFDNKCDYQKIHDTRVSLMADYISENGVQAKPGVRELTDYLKSNGYKIAIATATNYERANEHLTLAGVRDCFENIICASNVKHGKPSPDIYIYACNSIGLDPKNCAALEDSPNGIRAAYSAGCLPIVVPDNENPDEETVSISYAVADSLFGVKDLLGDIKNKG